MIDDQRGSRPVPDPTELTDRAISRLEKSLTAYIDGQLAIRDQRLSGIDEATKLRLEMSGRSWSSATTGFENAIEAAVGRLRDVNAEQFRSIGTQFQERDTLAQRESQLNKIALDAAFSASKEAVAAALTAQKEAASRQDEANQKAIDKSELATSEKINKLEQLVSVKTDALSDKIDSVKETANGSVQQKIGSTENRTATYAIIGLLGTVVVVGIAILTFVLAHTP